MRMKYFSVLLLVGIVTVIPELVCGEICQYRPHRLSSQFDSFVCPGEANLPHETDCCGNYNDKYCCAKDDQYSNKHPSWTIIAAIVAMVIGVGFLSTCAVCCCMATCPLYQNRKKDIRSTGANHVVNRPNRYPSGHFPEPPPYIKEQSSIIKYGYSHSPLPIGDKPPQYKLNSSNQSIATKFEVSSQYQRLPHSTSPSVSLSTSDIHLFSGLNGQGVILYPPPPPPSLSSFPDGTRANDRSRAFSVIKY